MPHNQKAPFFTEERFNLSLSNFLDWFQHRPELTPLERTEECTRIYDSVRAVDVRVSIYQFAFAKHGSGAGVDNAWEQKKLKATLREMLENGNDQAREKSAATIAHPCAGALGLPPSSARCVSPHLIFMDMVQKQLCYFSETCNKERPTSLSVKNLDP